MPSFNSSSLAIASLYLLFSSNPNLPIDCMTIWAQGSKVPPINTLI
jgi:hypothetical protein